MRIYAAAATLVGAAVIAVTINATAFAGTVNQTNNTNNKSEAQPQTQVTVIVGDTLSGIASNYSTTYERLFDANEEIVNPNLIYPGEIIDIPSSSQLLPDRTLPSEETVQPSASIQPEPISSTTTTPTNASSNIWNLLAQCESGGNWSINTGNGYYGGLQFTLGSWHLVGGIGYPNQASPSEQISRAEALQVIQGWGAWPVCSAKLGL